MNIYTWLWLAVGMAALIIETVAVTNSTKGDTLSEHIWAWLGVQRYRLVQPCIQCGFPVRRTEHGKWAHFVGYDPAVAGFHSAEGPAKTTPTRTLWLARMVLVLGMTWLIIHFVTGGWV